LEGCNGASFYPDPAAFFDTASSKNCWMKTFAETCEPPADAILDALAVLILKAGPECALYATIT
jgi:hypothetical protein